MLSIGQCWLNVCCHSTGLCVESHLAVFGNPVQVWHLGPEYGVDNVDYLSTPFDS